VLNSCQKTKFPVDRCALWNVYGHLATGPQTETEKHFPLFRSITITSQPICANLVPLQVVRAIGLFCGVAIVSSYKQQPLCLVPAIDTMGSRCNESSTRWQLGTGSWTVWHTTVHVAWRNTAAMHKQSDRRHFSFTAVQFAALCCACPRVSHFLDACNCIRPLV
jgi:hypothetical protein